MSERKKALSTTLPFAEMRKALLATGENLLEAGMPSGVREHAADYLGHLFEYFHIVVERYAVRRIDIPPIAASDVVACAGLAMVIHHNLHELEEYPGHFRAPHDIVLAMETVNTYFFAVLDPPQSS